MTELELLKTLLNISDTSEDTHLNALLLVAKNLILNRLYPFGIPEAEDDDTEVDVPSNLSFKKVEIAQFMYLKEGAEGETAHNENGISRSYENGYIPESMLGDITPYAKVS